MKLKSLGLFVVVVAAVAVAAIMWSGDAVQESHAKEATGELAARIGEKTITLAELDERAKRSNAQVYQDLFDARSRALNELIAEDVLLAEAKARGITPDELVNTEIVQKVGEVTAADVDAFYAANSGRMGGRSLEQMRGQILEFLQNEKRSAARQSFIGGLRAKAKVAVLLEPPRVEVEIAANDPRMGPDTAPVRIVEFSDFQCPYCARVGPTLARIRETYGDKVQIIFRDFPLPMHREAPLAHEAAQCALEQEKFWEYHDRLFENQQALAPVDLKAHASALSLDTERFNECLDTRKYRDQVNQDHQAGIQAGVTGTPAFFVNGRFLNGGQPFEVFQQIIDDELTR